MSEDWFHIVELLNGSVYLEGSRADQSQVCRHLTYGEVARIKGLQAKHDHEMQKLLRELAA